MRIIRALLLLFVFAVLGIVLGGSIWFGQQIVYSSQSANASTSPTPIPRTGVTQLLNQNSYTNQEIGFSLLLPNKTILLVGSLVGYDSTTTADTFSIQQQITSNQYQNTDSTLYVLKNSTTSSLAVAKKRLIANLTQGTHQDLTFVDSNLNALNIKHEAYTTLKGDTLELYRIEKNDLVFVVARQPGIGSATLTKDELAEMVVSFKEISTIQPSPTASLLNLKTP